MEETIILKREQQKIPSNCEVLGAVIAFVVIGFWFGIGATLAVKTVQNVEELISRKCQ